MKLEDVVILLHLKKNGIVIGQTGNWMIIGRGLHNA